MLLSKQFWATCLAATLMVMPMSVSSQDGDNVRPASQPSLSDAAMRDLVTRQKLSKTIGCDFKEEEFASVMKKLQEQIGVEMILDMSARDDSLSMDEPITFRIGKIPAKTLLRNMLTEHNATIFVDNGLVRIVSRDVAYDPEFFTRRVLDVSDILKVLNVRDANRIGTFTRTRQSAVVSTTAKSGGVFNQTAGMPQTANDATQTITEEFTVTADDLLIDAIKRSVSPDNWDDTNGDATVDLLGGLLIVYSTEKMGDEIEDLLQNMRYCWAK